MNLRVVGFAALLSTFSACHRPAPPAAAQAPVAASATASAPGVDAPVHVKGAEPIHISHGSTIKLADFVVPGKITIFDFYSEFCPPCRAIAPHLEKLHAARSDVAVVKVDINRPGVRGIDWDSPVIHQYQIQSVPHFAVVSPNGQVQAEGDEAYEQVVGLIKAAEHLE